MAILSWFDNRTLLACQFILAIVFAIVFFGMSRAYPAIRGIRSISYCTLLAVPGTLLLFSRELSVPLLVSVIAGNLFVLSSNLFMYDAVVRFTGGRRLTPYLWSVVFAPLGILYFYCQVHPNIVPRIIVVAIASCIIQSLTAYELLGKSVRFSSKITMRIFGLFLSFKVLVGLDRALMTALYGAPQNYMQHDTVQTLTLAVNVVYVCVVTLCFLFMASHELLTRSRDESQHDALSGAFNRRGIEAKLDAELKRVERSGQNLSIALIDLDHFKSINDTYGHAAGDTALRQVSQAIAERLRAYDSLGRFGGDEFLLILPQTPCNDALIVTSRLSHAVNSLTFANMPKTITLSIGLTQACNDDDATTLLARADKALYLAKNEGRNCRRIVLPEPTNPEITAISGNLPLDSILLPTSEPNLLQQ
jgi:diguanylate cyclase (GGDEF)-like protein